MNKGMLIALCGKKQVGKDTVADLLVEKYGFSKYGFADGVKDAVYRLNPRVLVNPVFYSSWFIDSYVSTPVQPVPVPLQEVVNIIGFETAKEKIGDVRILLQKMGTEVGREMFGEDVWVNRFLDKLFEDGQMTFDTSEGYPKPVPRGKIVVKDVRFDNEAREIRELGGVVVNVKRKEYSDDGDTHASELGVNPKLIDAVLINGRLDNLPKHVDSLFNYVKNKRRTV